MRRAAPRLRQGAPQNRESGVPKRLRPREGYSQPGPGAATKPEKRVAKPCSLQQGFGLPPQEPMRREEGEPPPSAPLPRHFQDSQRRSQGVSGGCEQVVKSAVRVNKVAIRTARTMEGVPQIQPGPPTRGIVCQSVSSPTPLRHLAHPTGSISPQLGPTRASVTRGTLRR